jgi:23S rRNA-/tRNA-specific pseudouridylate synthase
VYGHPDPRKGTWRDYLVWDRKALIQKRTHPRDPQAAEAVSSYFVVEQFRDASLIEVRLETGKRNQIRIQARLRGHTLIGEALHLRSGTAAANSVYTSGAARASPGVPPPSRWPRAAVRGAAAGRFP